MGLFAWFRWLRKRLAPKRVFPSPLSKATRLRILEGFGDYCSQREIAEVVGVSQSKVGRVVARATAVVRELHQTGASWDEIGVRTGYDQHFVDRICNGLETQAEEQQEQAVRDRAKPVVRQAAGRQRASGVNAMRRRPRA